MQRDFNIDIKLNHKNPIVFHNPSSYDSHLSMQEIGQLNFKLNVLPNGLEIYMSFSINNKLSFIDSLQFFCSSLNTLVKNLSKDDFKYLSHKFDGNILYLVKEKGF